MEQIDNLQTSKKFKKTEIGEIPVDWEIRKLGDFCAISSGEACQYSKNAMNESYPVFGSNGIIGYYNKYNFSDGLVIGRVGASGTIQLISTPIWATDNTLLLTIKKLDIDKSFVFYYLLRYNLSKLATQTAQPLITQSMLTQVGIALPAISEQKKIAEILTAVDDAIEKSDAVIEKTKQLKKGLMQELLTRGIGHKKFKKTEIGEIPVDWEVVIIEDCCDILDSQRIPLNDETRRDMKGSYPYYGANGLVDLINKFIFDEDLILMAEDGGYFDEYQIRPIAYLVNGKCWVNNHAHVLKAKTGWSREWIYYSIVHKNILPYIGGGTRSKLNQKQLRVIQIPAPPTIEQKKIAEILTGVDNEIDKAVENREKLNTIKKGLMQVLLTGKVRARSFVE